MSQQTTRLAGLDHDGLASLYGGIVTMSSEAALSLGSMEGVYQGATRTASPTDLLGQRLGYLIAAAAALAAYAVHYLPIAPFTITTSSGGTRHPIGAAIIAILMGVVIANLIQLPKQAIAGAKHAVRRVIPIAIVCVGAGLNLVAIGSAGPTAIGIIFSAVLIAYGSAYLIGRLLGLPHKTATLLGVGTGICGSSAIVAAAPLIDADDDDLVLSIGAVNLLGLVVMLLLPVLGTMLALDPTGFGIWCGATIHAVPQVLAAGDAYYGGGEQTLQSVEWATLIKLGRVALLAPMVFMLALLHAKQRNTEQAGGAVVRYHQLVPWFIWGFLAMAAMGTLGWLPLISFEGRAEPVALSGVIQLVGKLLLTFAMAAIGLGVNLKLLLGVGMRAVLAGVLSSGVLALAILGLVRWLM